MSLAGGVTVHAYFCAGCRASGPSPPSEKKQLGTDSAKSSVAHGLPRLELLMIQRAIFYLKSQSRTTPCLVRYAMAMHAAAGAIDCDIVSPASLQMLTSLPVAGTAGFHYMICRTCKLEMGELLREEIELIKRRAKVRRFAMSLSLKFKKSAVATSDSHGDSIHTVTPTPTRLR